MNRLRIVVTALLLGCILGSSQSLASGWEDRISISGFSSSDYYSTNTGLPFNGPENIGHDNKGSWSGTRMGLNINAKINKRFRFASQFFGSKPDGYILRVDWAFADLTLSNLLNLRAGKIKFPAGLVNEYVDVGYAMPWIQAPVTIYSTLGAPNGPQMTRKSYTGASLLGNTGAGNWTLGADLFGGEVALENTNVRELGGFSLTADWDDAILFQISGYQGVMRGTGTLMGGSMEGVKHKGLVYGAKSDLHNVIIYAERSDITMGSLTMMKATSWYTTIGYRINKVLPHFTVQSFEQGKGSMQEDKQSIKALGLRWDFLPGVAFKAEISRIITDKGVGLFPQGSTPMGTVNMIGFGLDTVF